MGNYKELGGRVYVRVRVQIPQSEKHVESTAMICTLPEATPEALEGFVAGLKAANPGMDIFFKRIVQGR